MPMIKVGDIVKVPMGVGEVLEIRNVEGTKYQTNKKNKIDYLVSIDDEKLPKYYQDWFEDFRTEKVERKMKIIITHRKALAIFNELVEEIPLTADNAEKILDLKDYILGQEKREQELTKQFMDTIEKTWLESGLGDE